MILPEKVQKAFDNLPIAQVYELRLRADAPVVACYRIGDYRVIVEIQDERVVVLVLRVGHRSKVYGGH